jgi:hypothetical protein
MILSFPTWSAAPGARKTCVIGDSLRLTPEDLGASSLITYAIASAPGGSAATIDTNGVITPDVVGEYALTASAGGATATFVVWCFSTAIRDAAGIGTYASGPSAGQARPTGDRVQLLQSISRNITSAQFASWLTGTWPSGLRLSAVGG